MMPRGHVLTAFVMLTLNYVTLVKCCPMVKFLVLFLSGLLKIGCFCDVDFKLCDYGMDKCCLMVKFFMLFVRVDY